jgi:succinyl-CoA synthetase beta subunit
MFLLEHDAKALLASEGIPVPNGVFVTSALYPPRPASDDRAGWVVKAQIRTGGRGKQGGIRLVSTWADAERETGLMIGRSIGGHMVAAVRIEDRVAAESEAYFSLSVAPGQRQIRVILSGTGGVEIEALHRAGGVVGSALADPNPAAVIAAVTGLAQAVGGAACLALESAGTQLVPLFFTHDLILLEINPLFLCRGGLWCAGDAKIVGDDNAVMRQPFLHQLLREKSAFYPNETRKQTHGFDYLILDADGEIGLLTTGAGLSMLLVDELRAAGLRPYNFLDVRSGGMHADPSRLIQVLRWLTEARHLRVVFCNIFAGSTDLGGFARLLVTALAAVPALAVPVVIRLVGNGADEARTVLEAAGLSLIDSLVEAVAQLRAVLADPHD